MTKCDKHPTKVKANYISISPEKCGYNTTLSHAESILLPCHDENNLKSTNETYSCYVHDKCEYYSFDDYDYLIDYGYNYLVIGNSVLGSVLFIWILIALCFLFKKCKTKYSSVDIDE